MFSGRTHLILCHPQSPRSPVMDCLSQSRMFILRKRVVRERSFIGYPERNAICGWKWDMRHRFARPFLYAEVKRASPLFQHRVRRFILVFCFSIFFSLHFPHRLFSQSHSSFNTFTPCMPAPLCLNVAIITNFTILIAVFDFSLLYIYIFF